jgi:hypothetical protein
MIISKSRDSAEDWGVYSRALGGASSMFLNRYLPEEVSIADWHNTDPSATLTTLGYGAETNTSGDDFIQYVFHSVDGYSKMGAYIGNGVTNSTDGTFVYLGFRPAWVMIKLVTYTGESWLIKDTERSPYNPADGYLYADKNAAEADSNAIRYIDYLSNGFKLRGWSSELNENTREYIYIAFAETPFKYSNAR